MAEALLGSSPPPMCMCGHAFHTGPCGSTDLLLTNRCGSIYSRACHCPDGELDGDR